MRNDPRRAGEDERAEQTHLGFDGVGRQLVKKLAQVARGSVELRSRPCDGHGGPVPVNTGYRTFAGAVQ